MKRIVYASVFSLCLVLCLTNAVNVNAQTAKKASKSVVLKSQKVENSRGENPNIKTTAPTTDKKVDKSRGDLCQINFDNYTGYYVNVYVDGNYQGQVGPYGSGNVYVVDGSYTTIYCQTAGGTYYWSTSGTCDYYFHYKLQ